MMKPIFKRLLIVAALVGLFASAVFASSVTGPIFNPASVAIRGGAINGTTVGATTPAAGTFSTLTSSNVAITGGAISGTTGQVVTAQTDATNALAGGHYGQTWQNVTGSRVLGTTYTNTTGKAIQVAYSASGSGGVTTYTGTVAGVGVAYMGFGSGSLGGTITFTVPSGATYVITTGGSTDSVHGWVELR